MAGGGGCYGCNTIAKICSKSDRRLAICRSIKSSSLGRMSLILHILLNRKKTKKCKNVHSYGLAINDAGNIGKEMIEAGKRKTTSFSSQVFLRLSHNKIWVLLSANPQFDLISDQ